MQPTPKVYFTTVLYFDFRVNACRLTVISTEFGVHTSTPLNVAYIFTIYLSRQTCEDGTTGCLSMLLYSLR